MGLSGKDGRLLQARKQMPRPGKPDLGLVGDIEAVNPDVLDMCLGKQYIPIVSPVGAGTDGTTYNINADVAAAEVAVALKARKLIFLTDVAGILDENGQLISQLTATELKTRLQEGKAVKGGMAVKANAILRALEGGVDQVHVVDGRVLHSVVVELFTDRGVGTLITA
jgi:acetylglutamate kinase